MKVPTTEAFNTRIRLRLQQETPVEDSQLVETRDAGRLLWAMVDPIHGLTIRLGAQTGEAPTHLFWIRSMPGTQAHEVSSGHVID